MLSVCLLMDASECHCLKAALSERHGALQWYLQWIRLQPFSFPPLLQSSLFLSWNSPSPLFFFHYLPYLIVHPSFLNLHPCFRLPRGGSAIGPVLKPTSNSPKPNMAPVTLVLCMSKSKWFLLSVCVHTSQWRSWPRWAWKLFFSYVILWFWWWPRAFLWLL